MRRLVREDPAACADWQRGQPTATWSPSPRLHPMSEDDIEDPSHLFIYLFEEGCVPYPSNQNHAGLTKIFAF